MEVLNIPPKRLNSSIAQRCETQCRTGFQPVSLSTARRISNDLNSGAHAHPQETSLIDPRQAGSPSYIAFRSVEPMSPKFVSTRCSRPRAKRFLEHTNCFAKPRVEALYALIPCFVNYVQLGWTNCIMRGVSRAGGVLRSDIAIVTRHEVPSLEFVHFREQKLTARGELGC
jgi:hypothetical protein